MRLLLALCLLLAVVTVTIAPASAAPQPGFGSWFRGVRDRIKNAIDKYKPKILQAIGAYNSGREAWGSIRDLLRGRRSVDALEYSVGVDGDAREDQLVADIDDLVESIVAEVIAGEVLRNYAEEHDDDQTVETAV